MKFRLIFFLLLFTSLFTTAQIDFEPGYFIDNTGNRVDCLIKNVGWRDNPSQFEYRMERNGISKTANVENVKEFGIGKYLKYEKHEVDIDFSSDITSELSRNSNPEFKRQTVFLKLLVEGKASLFVYTKGQVNRFFFKENESLLKSLVYKRFLREGGQIGSNMQFRQQLLTSVQCGNSLSRLKKLTYKESSLLPYFIDYNLCENSAAIVFEKPRDKNRLNLSLKLGASMTNTRIEQNLSFSTLATPRDVSADFSKVAPRFGFELEFPLPINNGKWALFADPFYQTVKGDDSINYVVGLTDVEVNVDLQYTTIEIPLGIRHYFFLNDTSRLYANLSFAFVMKTNSNINFQSDTPLGNIGDLDISGSEEYLSVGGGYKHKGFTIELRYNSSRDLLGDNPDWISKYSSNASLILGYAFL